MSKDQKGFVVYGDIEESLNELTDEQVATLFRGMVSYFNSGKDPKFTGLLKLAFIPIRQQMDRDTDKYEKKCEKNRASIKNYWDKVKANTNEYERIQTNTNVYERIPANTNVANTNTNTNTKTNTDTDTNTTSSETDALSVSSFLIGYLNEKAGTEYKPDQTTIGLITNLLDSGYNQDQMRTVIDKKCSDWLSSDKMRSFLRPSTLFGDKFGEYLAAPVSLAFEREKDEAEKRSDLTRQLTEKRKTLNVLRTSLEEIPRGTRMDERRALKEQIATLEDSIGLIERRLA